MSSAQELPKSIGRYEIVRLLGTGAMGRVALAHDPVLDRDVAVKLLRTDIAIAEDVREGLIVRMRHEARAAARVGHPNLVVLHDMGEDADAGLYLVFEYVAGPTLKQRLDRGPMRTTDVGRLARELGQALRFAHDAGVLHRDVKPDNVILSVTGSKLVDFGIARVPDSTLTHQGGLLGTPAYSAPETFRTGTFSPASDQFSLAATIYEAIFGERAFPGDDAVAVASRIAHEAAERRADKAGLPSAVDDVLARGLAKKPEDRYPDCEAFGRALDSSVRAKTVTVPVPATAVATAEAPAVASISVPPPPRKTHQMVIGAVIVVAAAVFVVRGLLRDAEPVDVEAEAARELTTPPPPAPPTVDARRARPAPQRPPDTRGGVAPAPAAAVDAGAPAASASAAPSVPPPASADAGPPADAGPAPRDAGAPATGPAPRDAGAPLDAGAR